MIGTVLEKNWNVLFEILQEIKSDVFLECARGGLALGIDRGSKTMIAVVKETWNPQFENN